MTTDNTSNSNKGLKYFMIGIVILIISIIILAVTNSPQPLGEKHKPAYDYGGDFVLRNHNGDVALKDFRGKVVVVYFGFLSCTEACPISMGTIIKATDKLTPEERAKMQVLFVSVDPKRDDVNDLKEFADYYAKRFKDDVNPNMILAITGTEDEIDKLSKQYNVSFEIVDLEGSAVPYTVDHSSRFYMIDGDGKLVTTMGHSTTPMELATQIKKMEKDLDK